MKSTNPLTKREWIFLIVILLLIQFVVHWLSLKYGSSVSALGYVSFAGTVVSILLGLIAIIYAFVQSFTQASSVVEIREQVDKLIDAGNDIVKSKDDLHRSAMELSSITDELSTKIGESILVTKEVAGNVGRLSDVFASHKPSVSSGSAEDVQSSEASVGVNCLTIFDSTKILVAIMVPAVAEGAKRNFNLEDIRVKIAEPLGGKLGYASGVLDGLLLMTVFTLEAEGFVTIKNPESAEVELLCSESFLARTESSFPRSNAGEYKEMVDFWSVIDALG